jgi:ubiquinone biosynthesis protein UbiJ
MSKGKHKRPRDTNKLAKLIGDIATGEKDDELSETSKRASKAGKVGGPARAEALTPEERSEIARLAAEARWKKGD